MILIIFFPMFALAFLNDRFYAAGLGIFRLFFAARLF